ncbi:MAG: HAMP domain-containing sensor histidine kinase [Cyanobacteria bacterium J06598_1]
MTLNPPTPDNPAKLQLAYQRLLALERFKSGFLARTSHELRSPINTIVSLHQLILEDLCEGPEEEKEFIGQSKDAALKMLALFDQITAVSKLDIGREPAKLETVDLSFLLPEVDMLTTLQAANQNIRYRVSAPTEELEIFTDAKWLKNLLTSLIQDAIPLTKFLTLTIEQTDQYIDIVIACDGTEPSSPYHTAENLQAELAAISQAADTEASAEKSERSPTKTHSQKRPHNAPIQLSTGLILATVHTALPLINGELIITEPTTETGSQIKYRFPVTQS